MDRTRKARISSSKKKPHKKIRDQEEKGEGSKPEPVKNGASADGDLPSLDGLEKKIKPEEEDPSGKVSDTSATSAVNKSKAEEADPSEKEDPSSEKKSEPEASGKEDSSSDKKSNPEEADLLGNASDTSATSAGNKSKPEEADPAKGSPGTAGTYSAVKKSKPEEDTSDKKSNLEEADTSATSSSEKKSKPEAATPTPEASADGDYPLLDGLKPLKRDSMDDVTYLLPTARKKFNRRKPDPSETDHQRRSSSDSQHQPKVHPQACSSSGSGEASHTSWAKLASAFRPASEITSPFTAATGRVTAKDNLTVDELIPILQAFLKDFVKKGDGSTAYYPSLSHSMNSRKSNLVTFNFYDFLSDKVYINLVLKTGNEGSHEWMALTVFEFLKQFGYKGPMVLISIPNKPRSVDYIEDFMLSKPCWWNYPCCEEQVPAATEHGRVGFVAGVRAVLQKHNEGISYGGGLKKEDMLIMDSVKCWLYGDQLQSNGTNCKLDMSAVWAIYKPFFSIDNYGSLPLEFEDLIEELTSVEENRVMNPTYRQLMWYYPTLAPPPAREVFVKDFCIAVRRIEGVPDEFIRARKFGHPSTWSTVEGASEGNWRDEFLPRGPTDSLVQSVFWHEVDMAAGGRQNDVEGVALPFDPTVKGAALCKRNVLEHADEHGAIDSPDMIEIYATSKFKHLMGYLFKKILELNKEERNKKFGFVLHAYKKLFG